MVQKIFILHLPIPVTVLLLRSELNSAVPLCSKQAKIFLFNKKLPLNSYRKSSSFTLNGSSGIPLIMQTAIGQGNTLVSPMHMALITSAIANDGVLMKPYLIDKVVKCRTVIRSKQQSPLTYKRSDDQQRSSNCSAN